jgi:hypothetical protein
MLHLNQGLRIFCTSIPDLQYLLFRIHVDYVYFADFDHSRFSLSYFIQASINLFCKILSSPFDPENNEDLDVISMISQLIESHSRHMDPDCYTAKVQFAAGVTFELKRLAQCAIDNASRQRNVTTHTNH